MDGMMIKDTFGRGEKLAKDGKNGKIMSAPWETVRVENPMHRHKHREKHGPRGRGARMERGGRMERRGNMGKGPVIRESGSDRQHQSMRSPHIMQHLLHSRGRFG